MVQDRPAEDDIFLTKKIPIISWMIGRLCGNETPGGDDKKVTMDDDVSFRLIIKNITIICLYFLKLLS